jgi:hypothetical protein
MPTPDRCARCDCGDEIAALKERAERAESDNAALREKLRYHDCAGGPNECGSCCTCLDLQAHHAIDGLREELARATACNEAMRAPMMKLREAAGMPAEGESYVIDSLLARLQKAESSAQTAHAGAAAMREALEQLSAHHSAHHSGFTPSRHVHTVGVEDAALSSSSGAAMLGRVRGAEQAEAGYHSAIANMYDEVRDDLRERLSRLLRACQSLHRAWRHQHIRAGAVAAAMAAHHKTAMERDSLRAEVERLKVSMAEHFQRDHLAGDGPEIDRWRTAAKANQREHDLVRQMRMELHSDDLITEAEYAALASEHGGVQRLEDYDVLRAQMESQDRDAAALRARVAALESSKGCAACEQLTHLRQRERALEGALQAFHPEREDEASENSEECQECGCSYSTHEGLSPSAECDVCAHDILEKGRAISRALLPAPRKESEPVMYCTSPGHRTFNGGCWDCGRPKAAPLADGGKEGK